MILKDHFDPVRKRVIPVAEYSPPAAARGILLFSVGFGGTRQGYAYLGRSWSSLGFLVVVVEHVGSNLDVLRQLKAEGPQRHHDLAQRIGEKIREPQELLDRPHDLLYIAHIYRGPLGAAGGKEGEANSLPLGLAGHSFGAYTVFAAAGCKIVLPSGARVKLKNTLRPSGLIAMSPQAPGRFLDGPGMAALDFPTLLVTGTLDAGIGHQDYRQRAEVFRFLPPQTRSLAVFEGADHMSFAGVGLKVRALMREVERITGSFWLSSLCSEPPWLEFAAKTQDQDGIYWNEEALCRVN